MINKNCLYCHKEFRVYPYQETVGRGKYCSKLCADKSRIGKPSWNAGTGKFLICKTCGEKFRDKKWRNRLVYCSRKCQLKGEWKTKVVKTLLMKSEDYTPEIRKKLSVSHLGEKSNRWRGGRAVCKDCGKVTSRYNATYCRGCYPKHINWSKEDLRKILRRRPMSGLEKRVSHIIDKYQLPYKFVGNGKFFIENKNPDFVNINGEKKVIEVYRKRHKDKFALGGFEGWKRDRLDVFGKYGWEVIFIEGTALTEASLLSALKGGDLLFRS